MPLPSTNRTAWFNASDNDKLYKGYPAPNGGNPADGEAVQSWDDEDATARHLAYYSTTDQSPLYRATGMNGLGCLDFDGTNDALIFEGDTLNTFIAPSAYTLFIAFRLESAANNAANPWQRTPLIKDAGDMFGVFLRTNGGVHTVEAYNDSGGAAVVTKTISLNIDYVVMVRHEAGNLYIAINNGSESSVASGDTGGLADSVALARGFSDYFNGKLGEIAIYDAALTGSNLTDAWAHFTSKWLTQVSAGAPLFRGRNFPFFDDEEVNRFEFWPAVAGGGNVQVALTGVAATPAVGSFTLSNSLALSGSAATATPGTFVPTNTLTISGNSATGEIGTLSFTETGQVGLTGVLATSAVETVSLSSTVSISGNEATVSVGTVTPVLLVEVALTGVSVTTSAGTLTPSNTLVLTGSEATTSIGTIGITETGQTSISGNQATVESGTLSPSTNPALAGVNTTGVGGSLTPSTTIGLSGLSATSAVGTVTGSSPINVALTGIEATTAVGSLSFTESGSLGLTGVGATSLIGSVQVGVSLGISGNESTASAGTITIERSSGLSGNTTIGSVGTVTTSRTVSLTGVSAGTVVGSLIPPAPGEAGLTGVAATGLVGTLTPRTFSSTGSEERTYTVVFESRLTIAEGAGRIINPERESILTVESDERTITVESDTRITNA